MRAHRLVVAFMATLLVATSSWVPVAAATASRPAATTTSAPARPPSGGERSGTTLAEKQAAMGLSIQAESEDNDIVVTPYDGTNFVTPDLLASRVMGGRGDISNATFTGAFGAAGMFVNGSSTFFVRDGILLSSGDVNGVLGPNVADNITTDHGLPGDTDLNGLVPGGGTQDAAVLEFDLVPQSSPITFHVVFASDEYNEYANSQFNDVFGFFVDGVNIAHLPGTTTNITVNSVNGGNPLGTNAVNPQFYNNNDLNDGGTLDTEMDGLTTVIRTEHTVNPSQTYHVKLAIADVGDQAYDSNVLLGAPNDCATFNSDAASVEPDATDADEPFFTVKYDPREIVPDNQPGFEAKAEQVAIAIRDRAELAADRYRQLGMPPNPNIEIRLTCDVDVDGRVPDEGHVKLKASTIAREFKPIIDSGFAGNTWKTPVEYWVSVVDHEIFHTFQTKKTGSSFIANLLLEIGNGIVVESGAMLGPDLQVDADHLADEPGPPPPEKNGFQYLDQTQFLFAEHPSIHSNHRYAFGALFQYWGERFGPQAPSTEHQVTEWYKRTLPTAAFCWPVCGIPTGVDAMQEALGDVNVYDALRDFYVAAYVRRAANVAASGDAFYRQFRFLDEEEGLPGAPYPNLTMTPEVGLANGPVDLIRTQQASLEKGSADAYTVSIPPGTTQIKATYTAKAAPPVGRGGFLGHGPTRLAFIPFAPDGNPNNSTTGVVALDYFATGNSPAKGSQDFLIDVAGRSELGIIVVASATNAAYTIHLERVVGTADLVIEAPTAAAPRHVVSGAASQLIPVTVRPTTAGVATPGLSRTSFTANVGGHAANVTQVLRLGDTYRVMLDPFLPLATGTYSVSVTFSGVTRTSVGAVVAEPPSGGNQKQDAAEATQDVVESGTVRAEAFFPSGGSAGTPIHLAVALSEPRLPTTGANATASITDPAGVTRTFPLRDRGGDGDTLEDDGVYGADAWATNVAGVYSITINVSGADSDGTPFSFVLPGSVSLTPKVDTDGDGVANAVEPVFEMNPAVADDVDHDLDGLSLSNELGRGTDPYAWDTDGGGENDASEVAAGRNPLAAADDGQTREVLIGGRSLDGNRIEITAQTNDGAGSIEIRRTNANDVSSTTLVTTLPGAETVFVDGPLPAGEYLYAAVTIGPTGAKSAPTVIGPFVAGADVTPPTARMVIEGGLWETADQDVTVAFFDLSEPVSEMRIAESEAALLASAWLPFEETSTFVIGSTPGDHLIYGQLRDASGQLSPVMSGIVELDPTPPSSTLGSLPATVSAPSVSIPFTATDGGTFIANVELWVRYRATTADPWGAWTLETAAASSPIPYTFAHGEGYYEFYSIAADGAGNREAAPAGADAFTRHSLNTAPTAPGGVIATAAAWNRVNLSWTASTDDVGVIRYEISRDGGPIAIVNSTVTTFTDWSVEREITHTYTVRAFDEAGNGSGASAPASATTPPYTHPIDTTAPSTPAYVTADQNVFPSSPGFPAVRVVWPPAYDDIEVIGYTILRNGSPIAAVNGIEHWEVFAHQFTDRTVVYGGTYTYAVRAFDEAGNTSAISPSATLTIPACPSCTQTYRPIADVANNGFSPKSGTTLYTQLREVAADGDTTYVNGPVAKAGSATLRVGTAAIGDMTESIQVQWNAKRAFQSGTTGAVTARVELYAGNTLIGTGASRSLSSSYVTYTDTFSSIPNAPSTELRVKISQLSASSKTYSRVTWLAVGVTSDPPTDTTAPAAPTNLSGTVVSDRRIDLSWMSGSDTGSLVHGFRVYRGGVLITTLPVGSLFRDVGLNASTTYEYRVAAIDGRGNVSPLSAPISVTTLAEPTPGDDETPPNQPTWGSATCVSPTRVNLAWNGATDDRGVQGYWITRNGVYLAPLLVGSTSFSDTGLTPGTSYQYAVQAVDAAGNSNWSNAISVTCPSP